MIKKILTLILFSTLSFSTFAIFAAPNFVLLPNVKTKYLMSTDASLAVNVEKSVIDLVKNTLNITDESPYNTIRVRLIYDDNNRVNALIVYLLSSQFKSLKIVRINLNSDFSVASIANNYQIQEEDLLQSPSYAARRAPHCPDETVQFVIGNNFGGDSSVEKEVQKTYQLAKEKGYNPVLLDINDAEGPQPTVSAYENWLSCPKLKGFYNESHGWNHGIVLSDDDFLFKRIDQRFTGKLDHEVILFDSCETFNNPLLGAMTDKARGNAQQYIAGKDPLPFGASERTSTCIWAQAMKQGELTQALVNDCSAKNRLEKNNFRITGNGSKFLAKAN